MLKYLLLAFVSCHAVEFSSRPTNVTITLLYFTQAGTGKTTVLAPYGLWTLMAGLSYGSTGDTYREIFRAFLLFTDRNKLTREYKALKTAVFQPTPKVKILNKNFCFVDNNFQGLVTDEFRDMMVNDFDTAYKVIDFEDPLTARIANSYVENMATGVPHVFRPDDFKTTSLILGNVFYFKSLWSLPFNTQETKSENGLRILYQRAKVPYCHIDAMQASVIELFYGDEKKFSMLIITPDPGVDITTVYRNFVHLTIRDIFANLAINTRDSGLKEMDVELPKITRITNVHLNRPLNDMGVYDSFEPEQAKFSKMAREPIFIDTIETSVTLIMNELETIVFATIPGLREENIRNEKLPQKILFVVEKTTATLIFGAILT